MSCHLLPSGFPSPTTGHTQFCEQEKGTGPGQAWYRFLLAFEPHD